jgi:CelD/BcsL family acetyltransferase involved in cellulose biosynthesis
VLDTAIFTPAVDHAVCTLKEAGSPSDFARLQEEWGELLSSSDSDCLFLTWEWLHTWWTHLAEDRVLSLLTVRRGGELIGLAPFCLRPRRLRQGRPFQQIEFLGSGQVGSDYLDVIARANCEADVREALAAHFTKRPTLLKWTQLKRFGSLAAGTASDLSRQGWTAVEAKTNTCPFISLNNLSWDSYIAGLGASHRYDLRRKWNRLHRDYVVRFEQVETQRRCRQSIDLLIEQHNTRWRERGGSDAFHTTALIGFHREFAQIALERGWLRLYVLWLNERPAAHLYGFRYRNVFYFYQSSFDSTFEKYSVGMILMGHAIKSAIEEGASEFDLLHGTEAYKSHWSRENRDLVRIELFPPGDLGKFYQSSFAAARKLRAVSRRVRRENSIL